MGVLETTFVVLDMKDDCRSWYTRNNICSFIGERRLSFMGVLETTFVVLDVKDDCRSWVY
jgi:hypothetical protein